MDIVAVEIYPEQDWIRKGAQTDLLVTDLMERAEDGEEVKQIVDVELKRNLVEVLEKTDKQLIGRVVGVLQVSDKRYAGSTVKNADLMAEDRQYLSNLLGKDFEQYYRLFIPFDKRV